MRSSSKSRTVIAAWLGLWGTPATAVDAFTETFSGLGEFSALALVDGSGAPIPGVMATPGFENEGWVHFADSLPTAQFDTMEGTLGFRVTRSDQPVSREILQREIGTGSFVEEIHLNNLDLGEQSLASVNVVHQGSAYDAFSFQISDLGSPGQLSLFLSLNYLFRPESKVVRELDFEPGSDLAIRVTFTESTDTDSARYAVETRVNDDPYVEQYREAFLGLATAARTAVLQLTASGSAGLVAADVDYWRVAAVGPPPEADFDKDGDVDGEDFLIWQSGFLTTTGAAANDGDANRDGTVDGDDFLVWQTQFGSGSSSPSRSAVPEPGGSLLAVWIALAATTPRRKPR